MAIQETSVNEAQNSINKLQFKAARFKRFMEGHETFDKKVQNMDRVINMIFRSRQSSVSYFDACNSKIYKILKGEWYNISSESQIHCKRVMKLASSEKREVYKLDGDLEEIPFMHFTPNKYTIFSNYEGFFSFIFQV